MHLINCNLHFGKYLMYWILMDSLIINGVYLSSQQPYNCLKAFWICRMLSTPREHPLKWDYTVFSHCHLSYSRIDFILASTNLVVQMNSAVIGDHSLSDHAYVYLLCGGYRRTGRDLGCVRLISFGWILFVAVLYGSSGVVNIYITSVHLR